MPAADVTGNGWGACGARTTRSEGMVNSYGSE
jgi:hypothetical protein